MRTAGLTSFALTGLVLVSAAAPAPPWWRRLLPTVSGSLATTPLLSTAAPAFQVWHSLKV